MVVKRKAAILWEGRGPNEYLFVISRVLKYANFYLSSTGVNNVSLWYDAEIMPFRKEYNAEDPFTSLLPYVEDYNKKGYPAVLFVLDKMPLWLLDKNGNPSRGLTNLGKHFGIAVKPQQYSMIPFIMCNLMYPIWHEYMHIILSLINCALSAELDRMKRFYYQSYTFDEIPRKVPNILVKAKRKIIG